LVQVLAVGAVARYHVQGLAQDKVPKSGLVHRSRGCSVERQGAGVWEGLVLDFAARWVGWLMKAWLVNPIVIVYERFSFLCWVGPHVVI
jgi:hypothetical protein